MSGIWGIGLMRRLVNNAGMVRGREHVGGESLIKLDFLDTDHKLDQISVWS